MVTGEADGTLIIESGKRQGFAMLARLFLNSSPNAICLPQPPKVLGLQAVLLLMPRLKCTGTISANCNLCFPGSIEMGFLHVGKVGLKLLTLGDSPTSIFQSAGITATPVSLAC
ncbi:hypothetical protein AAY473_034410 [Plecturocebus cupreus]